MVRKEAVPRSVRERTRPSEETKRTDSETRRYEEIVERGMWPGRLRGGSGERGRESLHVDRRARSSELFISGTMREKKIITV